MKSVFFEYTHNFHSIPENYDKIETNHASRIQQRTEEELWISEERLNRIISVSGELICELDDQGRYSFVSTLFEKVLGFKSDELIGKAAIEFIHPDDHEAVGLKLGAIKPDKDISIDEWRFRDKEGKYHTFLCRSGVFISKDGTPTTVFISQDITDRKKAEEKTKSLLAEKNILLREVHHRIKNHMNILYNLLLLQSNQIKNPDAETALKNAGKRILSMQILYDKLYLSDNFREVSAVQYLSSLIDEIAASCPNFSTVKIEKKIDDFNLDVKKIQPLGIIINELLSNIMKYAFKGRNDGIITVSASIKDNSVLVIIKDNGNGMPESVTFKNSTCFGLHLVELLTLQLNGTIRIERKNGTGVILEFENKTE